MARDARDELDRYRLAAEFGEAEAQYRLGLCYATGKGVERDYIFAHMWLNLAAMKGNEEARQHRADIAAEMLPGEVARAQRQAREWMRAH